MNESLKKIKKPLRIKRYAFGVIFQLLVVCFVTNAQQINIDWGTLNKKQDKSYIDKLVGGDADSFYVVRKRVASLFSPGKILIEKFDRLSLRLRFSKEIKMPETDGIKHNYENSIYINGQFILFTSYYDPKIESNLACAWRLTENASLIPNKIVVDGIPSTKKSNSGSFDFLISPDQKNILVYHNDPYKKKEKEKFACTLLNDTLGIVYKKSFELPYTDKESHIREYKLDNFGNVTLLVKVTIEESEKNNTKAANFYSLLTIKKESESLKEYKINLGNKTISAITFSPTNDKNVVVAGFYSNIGRSEQEIAGAFYLKIDSELNTIINNNTKDFDKEFLLEFLSQQRVDKKRELRDFLLKNLRVLPDGSTILVAEQYEESTVCYNDVRTGMINCTYYYYYNDIIVVKFDAMGMFQWSKRIPKAQLSINDKGTYSSFIISDYDNQIYIIFNDNPTNVNPKNTVGNNPRTMDNPKRSITVLVAIASNGEMAKLPIFKAADQKIYISPKLYSNLTNSELILYGQKGSNYKFGRIAFQ